ncbi:hypothetical protein AVEN_68663-1 [Araneus ventricosus]|uniref:Uncharacterized protein n=1 Tax=Araneus ventricosus TaxID=182803 RepID=A0A4Y2KT30_ARAVE|nr:hypothetical protein AVEN_68663-1 [Araneus ventricosus]
MVPRQLPRETIIPLPQGSTFCGFAFEREPRSASPRSHFSFMIKLPKWITNENEIQTLQPQHASSQRRPVLERSDRIAEELSHLHVMLKFPLYRTITLAPTYQVNP